ncbi:DEAD/DEAH box helicase [Desulfogranum japonicum]|uniref:DEAD/DEAH box helicase n=1 Tax=Desulfogranum japonicum TaxID=231447 RepID=UPI00041DCEC7|nr:DEAD/DEAH box helicase [Desulfogranum japonicum]
MSSIQENVDEYLQAMKNSERFSQQLIAHKLISGNREQTVSAISLHHTLQQILEKIGLHSLYSHQYKSIENILAGKNIIISTQTSSGKSLVYNLPVLLHALQDEIQHKALYLFPLKALAQDQHRSLTTMAAKLRDNIPQNIPFAEIYDGDTSAYKRSKIRKNSPRVLITNPDMLHLALLPYHEQWAHFFSKLRYIVIDEVHTFKGIFGSHVSWLLKRLRRICEYYAVQPIFILASATVGNPQELARELTGLNFVAISESGAKTAPKHITLLNPIDSAAGAATALVESAIRRKLRTIVYTQSRKMTELIAMWIGRRMPAEKHLTASYRAGFLPEDRRDIEHRLASGDLLAVISTSALELGIDIGNLDICILVGYPGSMMATWQRAGRVGRSGQKSLVILIGHEDALDQYFMRNPEEFYTRPVEPVIINPRNQTITRQHLVCAAAEIPLREGEEILTLDEHLTVLTELTLSGDLLQSANGDIWYAARKFPQRHVHLRGGGAHFNLYKKGEKKSFGDVDGHRVYTECHTGAVYLHMAKQYLVNHLDLENQNVLLSPFKGGYYTKALTEKNTEILQIYDQKELPGATVCFGMLRVSEQVTSYLRILHGNQRVIGKTPLDLPATIYETEGFWIVFPDTLKHEIDAEQLHYMGGIHAMEHAIIGLLPLFVLCDRNDIGGISFPWNQQLNASAVFVYDGYAGGMGLTREGFASLEKLLPETLKAVKNCSCHTGCPSCVHSPKCGSGNRPIDKQACTNILASILRPSGSPDIKKQGVTSLSPSNIPDAQEDSILVNLRFGVFDLETQKSAQEVGGWHRCHLMGISVAVLYDSVQDRYFSYEENNIEKFLEHLAGFDLVVGFNNKRFDNKVLSAYTDIPLSTFPSLDLLEVIHTQLGYRLSLDRLAEKTLGIKKSGNGLQALEWYRKGEMKKLSAYCLQDVKITKNLFLFAYRKHHLLFQNKAGNTVRLPVNIHDAIRNILQRQKN